MRHVVRWMPYLGLGTIALFFVVGAQFVRPLPFATTDDGPMYFLPLIKAHTDSALDGHLLRAIWELGAGWTPLESGQIGFFYFPYHIANLLARALGEPLAILEVSAAIHLCIAGMVTYTMLPSRIIGLGRFAWAGLVMLQPAPILIGLNWHNYLASYPWFVGMALILMREMERSDGMPHAPPWQLYLFGVLFFLSSHPQMYVIGCMALMGWIMVESWRARGHYELKNFCLSQLPLAVPLIFYKWKSLNATSNWMAGRDDTDFILRGSQDLETWMEGVLFGNLMDTTSFSLWKGVSSSGVGMFFSPALVLLLVLAARNREKPLLVFFAILIMFMSIDSFSILHAVAIGPLAGFRWTWKISVLVAPLAIIALLRRTPVDFHFPRQNASIIAATLLSGLVSVRGLDFDLWPSLRIIHDRGIASAVRETQELLRGAGVSEGSRIALITEAKMWEPLPVPLVTLVGNGPLLLGHGSAHIYEPLEPSQVSSVHYGLTTPWRKPRLGEEEYRRDPKGTEEALMAIGVNAVLTPIAGLFDQKSAVELTDSTGGKTYLLKLNGAIREFPHANTGGAIIELEKRPGGIVRTNVPIESAPVLASPRVVEWSQLPDSRWSAQPELVSWKWLVGTLLGILFTAFLHYKTRRSPVATLRWYLR